MKQIYRGGLESREREVEAAVCESGGGKIGFGVLISLALFIFFIDFRSVYSESRSFLKAPLRKSVKALARRVGDTDNTTDTEEAPKEEKSVGIIKGKVYTPQLKTVSDLKIYMRGVGETVTDKDGAFVFNDIPVGEYEVYTVLDDGKEYVFRTVDVKENVELSVKLKYDVSANASVEEEADFNFVWIIIPIAAVIVAAGVAVIIILKKKSAKK